MSFSDTKVAVVGAGPAGMVALQELRDLGFDVTLFEKREDVGGVWSWTENPSSTTALKETTICNNKYSDCMSDFPPPKDFPWNPKSPEMGAYLRSYAKHHDLYRNIQFNKVVTKLTRDESSKKWQLTFSDDPSTPLSFDKVAWATGGFVNPRPITLAGQENFKGRILHSSAARDLSAFKGQNVVVLGIGNTAADVANALVGHGASKVYLSHRRGAKIVRPSDKKNGVPNDVMLTTGIAPVGWWLQANVPSMYGKIMDSTIAGNFKDSWGVNNPDWGLSDAPSLADGLHVVICSQDLIPNIQAGRIDSVPGIKTLASLNTVVLDNGRTLTGIDAIIGCVGYHDDCAMLHDAIDFTDTPAGPLPNIYMNIFPPRYADSFAHLSLTHLSSPQIPGRQLAALALAQIWARRSPLPSPDTMQAWISRHQSWLQKRIAKAPNGHRYMEVEDGEWNYFLHEAAGTGLYEHIGWGRKAWGLWWRDRELYRAVSGMPICAVTYRIFETGKRRRWEGAREAVLEAWRDVEALKKGVGKQAE